MTTLPDIASAPLPARFEPKTTKEKVSVFTAAIEHAQRVRDWVGLANAVEAKIEEQAEFVEWWKGHIRPEGRPGKTVSDPKLLSVYLYTRQKKQRVSRSFKSTSGPSAWPIETRTARSFMGRRGERR